MIEHQNQIHFNTMQDFLHADNHNHLQPMLKSNSVVKKLGSRVFSGMTDDESAAYGDGRTGDCKTFRNVEIMLAQRIGNHFHFRRHEDKEMFDNTTTLVETKNALACQILLVGVRFVCFIF